MQRGDLEREFTNSVCFIGGVLRLGHPALDLLYERKWKRRFSKS